MWPISKFWGPVISVEWMKLDIYFQFGMQIDRNEYYYMHVKISQYRAVFKVTWHLKILGEITANISETVPDKDAGQQKTNRKSSVLWIGTYINDLQDLEWPWRSFAYCKLLQMAFSYRSAVVDKFSTDIACSRCPSAVAKLLVISKLNTEHQRSHNRPTSSAPCATLQLH